MNETTTKDDCTKKKNWNKYSSPPLLFESSQLRPQIPIIRLKRIELIQQRLSLTLVRPPHCVDLLLRLLQLRLTLRQLRH